MPKYVIEREIPGAGDLSNDDLRAISRKSCGILEQMGPDIQWLHSYVTADKVYCVYIAPEEAVVRAHAAQGGFPANRVSRVLTVIDPTTAESSPCESGMTRRSDQYGSRSTGVDSGLAGARVAVDPHG